MKDKSLKVIGSLLVIVVAVVVVRCTSVPITGRKQLLLMPESSMMAMSFTQYDDFLKETKVSTDKKNTELVKSVGARISKAVEQYMANQGLSSHLDGYAWEFNLVDDATPNAWCMPGGKVVFYTGILPYCQDENGIAVVMGHEIAHAVARHGNERMSQQMVTQFGAELGSAMLSEKSPQTQAVFSTVYGLGSQLLVALPYSRNHETEADKLGLIFMAMAGYNPEHAITFWQRMASSSGAKSPQFLSTHPSDETRVRDLQNFMHEALKYYNK